jgi:hypothetical protein
VKRVPWMPEEDEILRRAFPHNRTSKVARVLRRSESSVHQRARKLGLKKAPAYLASPEACRLRRGDEAGKAYRFPKGHVPANKGLRRPGWHAGRMRETQFKKGAMHGAAQHNYVPIGTLRVKDGVLARKVTDDPSMYPARRWVPVHRTVWEAAHGPVPAGHVVRFRDGMKTLIEDEITVDRLELVTFAENMRRNTVHRYPKEIVQLVQLRGALNRKINRRSKQA